MTDQIDLTDFAYMPLYVARLQRSKAWLRCKRQPELAFYMLNLWLRSWHEVPAGTIENDDDVLADAAMCSPEKWAKIRDKVLVGWSIDPATNRLQHQVVLEIAQESWTDKQEYRRKKEEERLRKAAKRAQTGGGEKPDGDGVSAGCPPDKTGTDIGSPPENPLKESVSISIRDTTDAKTCPPDIAEERDRRFYLIRRAMNVDDDDPTWNAVFGWLEVWQARGVDFEKDVYATVLSMMSKKPKTFTPRALAYFDDTIQQNFDARRRRDESPAPRSTLPEPDQVFDPEISKWQARLGGFKTSGAWSPNWGAKPGEPGCQVPPSLLDAAA